MTSHKNKAAGLSIFIVVFLSLHTKAQTPDNSTKAGAATTTAPPYVTYPSNVPVNFVKTWIPQKPYSSGDDVFSKDRTVTEVNHVTEYMDGFGRHLQTVNWQASPVTGSGNIAKKDLVAFSTYDDYGRETYQYLPFNGGTPDGFLYTSPAYVQNTFYTIYYPDDQPNYKNEVTYGKIIYDNTPLNRVVKTFAPGNSWAGTEGSTTAEHATKIDYQYNTSADNVRTWTIGNNALTYANNDVTTNIPTTSAIYADNQLSETTVTDEHGKKTVAYKDNEGRTLLKKVQIAATPSADYTGWLCTFYVYDNFGRLRFVIPPKAVAALSNTATFNWNLSYNNTNLINELCFRYEYDGKNRLIAKKSPGAGWVYMVYDKRDRLVYTQDANLRNSNRWMGTWYDDLDRPIETGMLTGYTGNREALQTAVLAASSYTQSLTNLPFTSATAKDLFISNWAERRAGYQASNSVVWEPGFVCEPAANETITAQIVSAASSTFNSSLAFSNNIVPTGGTFIPLTLTYYDNYDWTNKNYTVTNNSQLDDIGANPYGDPLPSTKSIKTNGLVTGSRVKVIEDPNDLTKGAWLESAGFYDDKDRLVQVQSDNYKGGVDVITSRYSFTGDVLNTYEVYNNASGNVSNLRIKTLMEYDHAGRLLTVTKTINDDATKKRLVAQYAYDALGNLLTKKLGQKTSNGTPVSGSVLENDNYSYNIRGWLKGINWGNYGGGTGPTTAQTNTASDKWFAMDLSYDWGFSVNQFNGSIAGQRWKSAGDMEERSDGYSYDAANRFTSADFRQKFSTGWTNTDPNPPSGSSFQIDFSVSSIAYDENGNLKTMKQYGLQSNTSPLLDDLTYTPVDNYSNKLKTVTDGATTTANSFGDFVHNSTGTVDYGYDKNGNLITDLNKKFNGTATGIDQTTGGAILYNYLDQAYQVNAKDANNNNKTIFYIYDAAGNKLEKRSTAADGNVTVTTYIGEFVYQNNVLQYFSHEEGRVRVQRDPATGAFKDYVYDYFITDHLGNVRMILTDEVPDRELYLATMETAKRSFETALFGDKVNSTAQSPKPAGFDTDGSNAVVSKVNGTTEEGRVGPGVILKVMAGDKYKASTYAWYQPTGMDNTVNTALGDIAINLLSQLTPGVAYIGKGELAGSATSTILQPGLKSFTGTQTPLTGAPKAYLNYVVLDEKSFKAVQSGFVAVPQITGTTQKQLLQLNSGSDISITHNGYLYVWVSNESKGNVYFDDIRVEHQQGPLLEENHYYPYGLKMSALCSRAFGSLLNKFQYQGSYSEFDEETGYDEFALRNYDPQLGRWTGVDPYDEFPSPYTGMGNDPVNNVDEDGGMSGAAIGGIAGAVVGGVAAYLIARNNIDSKWGIAGITIGGALIGSGLGYGTGGIFDGVPFGTGVRDFYTSLVGLKDRPINSAYHGIGNNSHVGGGGVMSHDFYSWIGNIHLNLDLGDWWEDFSDPIFTRDDYIVQVVAALNQYGRVVPAYNPSTQSLTQTVNVPAPPPGSRNVAVVTPFGAGGQSAFDGGIIGNQQTNSANVNGIVTSAGKIVIGTTPGPVTVILNARASDPRYFVAPTNTVTISSESRYRRTGQKLKFFKKIRRRVRTQRVPFP